MIFGYIDYLVARERHQDLLRQAERDRLLRQVRSSGSGKRRQQNGPLTFRGLAGSFAQLAARVRKQRMAPVQPALSLCCGCGTSSGQRCG